jgi:hypothetical protein
MDLSSGNKTAKLNAILKCRRLVKMKEGGSANEEKKRSKKITELVIRVQRDTWIVYNIQDLIHFDSGVKVESENTRFARY